MRKSIVVCLLIGILLLLVSCLKQYDITSTMKKKSSSSPLTIAFITKMQTGEHWGAIKSGARNAVAERGGTIEFFAPINETNYEEQITLIDYAIEKNFDCIVIACIHHTALNNAIERAMNQGVSVVTIDSGVSNLNKITQIGSNNYQLGRRVVSEGLKLINKDEKLSPVIVGSIEQSANMIDRMRGISYELDLHDIQPVILYSGAEEATAALLIQETLKQYPSTNLIIALEENSAQGAAKALRHINQNKISALIAFGSSKGQIEMLENEIIDTLVVENLFTMGYLGVQSVIDQKVNKKSVSKITTDYVIITKDTLMNPENQRFAFPIY